MIARASARRVRLSARYLPAPPPITPPVVALAVIPPQTPLSRLKLAWLLTTARFFPARYLAPKPRLQQSL
jgi:hypothetical protein